MRTFDELGLSQELLKALGEIGFTSPTEIQDKSIPQLVENKTDFIGLAQTGTGKTAAFGLPLIDYYDDRSKSLYGLILAPTRELVQQIEKELESFSRFKKGIKIYSVYGGVSISGNLRYLKSKTPDILVATPGRLQDLINRKAIDLSQLEFLVLDEADEMLNMGFQEAVDQILESTPPNRYVWLFSATMPPEIRKIVANYMDAPYEVIVKSESKTNENIEHKYIYVHKKDKAPALKRILDYVTDFYGVVFCRTKMDTQDLADYLEREGYRAEPLHGDMSQAQRDAVMAKFRSRTTTILVATDVAARGIDVDDLTHVVHFALPENPEYYTHRSGRTARAGKKGTSIAIVSPEDIRRIRFFEKVVQIKMEHFKVPLQSQMFHKKLEKWVEKILNTETTSISEDLFLRGAALFEEHDKDELIKRLIAYEFNRLLKKSEKDDLNLQQFAEKERKSKHADSDRKSKKSSFDRPQKSGSDRKNKNDVYYINLGKVDKINPMTLIDLFGKHIGIPKREIGDIEIHKLYSLVEIEKGRLQTIRSAKNLSFNQRKINIKLDK